MIMDRDYEHEPGIENDMTSEDWHD